MSVTRLVQAVGAALAPLAVVIVLGRLLIPGDYESDDGFDPVFMIFGLAFIVAVVLGIRFAAAVWRRSA